jgi:hypothetical protein
MSPRANRKKYISVTDPDFKRTDGSKYKPTPTLGQKTTSHIYNKSLVLIKGKSKEKGKGKAVSEEEDEPV